MAPPQPSVLELANPWFGGLVRTNRLWLCFVLSALASPVLAVETTAKKPCTLADLQWMAGTWRDTEEANVLTEERWAIGPCIPGATGRAELAR